MILSVKTIQHGTHANLVGGFKPFEKYSSKCESSPNRGEIKNIWNYHLEMEITLSNMFMVDISMAALFKTGWGILGGILPQWSWSKIAAPPKFDMEPENDGFQ